MTARTAAVGIGVMTLLALLGVAVVVAAQGTSAPALTGLLLGAALGGLSLAAEALSLGWALKRKPSWMLGVSLGGFGLRLVLVSALTIWFACLDSVDAVTFALTYVASVLLFIGAWAIIRGVLEVYAAVQLRKMIEGEALLATVGVLSILFGIIVMARPDIAAIGILWTIGIYLIVSGVLLVLLGMRMRRAIKSLEAAAA